MQQPVENQLDINEPRWFAVYTRHKAEKVVARLLTSKKIESYLPICKRVRKYDRKVRIFELPLISGYVFVKIIKAEYVTVLETENVVNFVKFARNLIAISDREINILRRVTDDETIEIALEKTTFVQGDRVKIAHGNLYGLEGTLVSAQGKNKLLVELENLGYTLYLTVNSSLLEKI